MSLLPQLTLINPSSYHTKWQDNSWHWLSLHSVSSILPPSEFPNGMEGTLHKDPQGMASLTTQTNCC